MWQLATTSLTALGALSTGLAICAALVVGWQQAWMRQYLIGAFTAILIVLGLLSANESADHSQGGLLRQLLTGSIYLCALGIFLFNRAGKLDVQWRLIPTSLALLLTLAMASVFWSEVPQVTARRAIQCAGVIFFGLAIVRSFDSRELWTRYLNPVVLWVVVGLCVLPILPDFAFDDDGNFRGLSTHKNSWGGFALAGALIAAWQLRRAGHTFFNWFSLSACVLTITLTRSATALSVVAVALFLLMVAHVLRSSDKLLKQSALAIVLVAICLPLVWLLSTGTSPAQTALNLYLDIVQKESTLTGRNVLWETVLDHAWLSPWFGTGYGAFWIGDAGPSVGVLAALNWSPVHSHNGFVDLFNELGLAGCAMFALTIAIHLGNLLRLYQRGQSDDALFHLTLVFAVLAYNLAESSIMLATHSLWVILVVSIVDAHRLANVASTAQRRDS